MKRKFRSRRGFFSTLAIAGASAAIPSTLPRAAAATGDMNDEGARKSRARDMRTRLANYYNDMPLSTHDTNGDEERYPSKIATYSKLLRHNGIGEVDPASYASLRAATDSGDPKLYDAIQMGGPFRFKTPQASHSFQVMGIDASQLRMPPAPRFDSAEMAGEMVELYWMSNLRDLNFNNYDRDPDVRRACAELSRLSDFRGPKVNAQVTPGALFRGDAPGVQNGPFISQFLLKDVNQRNISFSQKMKVFALGNNYLTQMDAYLQTQNAITKGEPPHYAKDLSYIKNLRDLATYVWLDLSYIVYLNAALIAVEFGPEAVNDWNFYRWNTTQEGYINFGPPDLTDWIARAARPGYLAAWYQKWQVHRRARPEAIGCRVNMHLAQKAVYPLHKELLESEALKESASLNGSYLLPQAFPEGSPGHSAYPSGHATVGGAMVTMMKAYFNEDFVIPNPVMTDGNALFPYEGPPLTIGGELNKLVTNIATARNAAGIHYRSDMVEGMKLGEQVAIHLLRDIASTYTEDFAGFHFRNFAGEEVTVCAYC